MILRIECKHNRISFTKYLFLFLLLVLTQLTAAQTADTKILLDFEESDRVKEKNRSYLNEYSDKAYSGKSSAIVRFAHYNNLRLEESSMYDWSGYDYVAMEVFNPLDINVPFNLVINDKPDGGYWNQLNHNTMIKPGWNTLKFHVNRYVGERGSIRVYRYVDLKKIRKFWFAISAEDKRKEQFKNEEFLVDSIRLLKAPKPPKVFEELKLYDFVKDKFRTQRGFQTVTRESLYTKEAGFGFVDTVIHNVHDSEHASTLNRDGIWVNKGHFRVDLPNGKYTVHINPYHLGLWFEQYWKKRTLKIQGKTVLDETCISIEDHLNRFLKFQDIEPEPGDHPYELYIDRLLKPIVTEVEVKDGFLKIEYEGSVTGICLNWLIVYPNTQAKKGQDFVKKLKPVLKDEYEQLMKSVPKKAVVDSNAMSEEQKRDGIYTALVGSDEFVRYGDILKTRGKSIELDGGYGERPMQAFMARNLKKNPVTLKISTTELKSKEGHVIAFKPEWIRYGVNQYQSWGFKHETYQLAPRFLRALPKEGLLLKQNLSRLFWLQIPLLESSIQAGTYKGVLNLDFGHKKVAYPLTLRVHAYELPKLDIAAGFFGLNPMPWGWYRPNGYVEWERKTRETILDILGERGFTTWSGLPEIRWRKNKEGQWVPGKEDVDHLMKAARERGFNHKIFTYGGIPFNIVRSDAKSGLGHLNEQDYYAYASKAWSKAVKDGDWLPIVYDYSDEPALYSQKVEEDMRESKFLMKYYPNLLRGGYSHAIPKDEYGYDLNLTFTDISVSSVTKEFSDVIQKKGARWGFYNPCLLLTQNNRQAYGEALFAAKKDGCDHMLGWFLTLHQNYPYFDLDGRENDAMMIFLKKDASFDMALKFEWAALGTEDYRLLMLLEQLANAAGSKGAEARQWLKKNYDDVNIFEHKNYLSHRVNEHTYEKSQQFRKTVKAYILELVGDQPKLKVKKASVRKSSKLMSLPNETMLFDFEDGSNDWSNQNIKGYKEPHVEIESSLQHVTSGKKSLKLSFTGGHLPTVYSEKITLKDWTGYKSLLADVYLERDALVVFRVMQEKSIRENHWNGYVGRYERAAIMKKGHHTLVALLNKKRDTKFSMNNGKVLRFEIALYDAVQGDVIYLDSIRVSKNEPAYEKTPLSQLPEYIPTKGTLFKVLGSDLKVKDFADLAKQKESEWKESKTQSLSEIKQNFNKIYEDHKRKDSSVRMCILQNGKPIASDGGDGETYAGWDDTYITCHEPESMLTVTGLKNFGNVGQYEMFMRHRVALMRANLSVLPKHAKILYAALVVSRTKREEPSRSYRNRNMWVVELCNRPWVESEVNAFQYARHQYWNNYSGRQWHGENPDSLPIIAAYGPGQGQHNVWDFTHAVKWWVEQENPNHGFWLYGDSKDWFLEAHYSESKDVEKRPMLMIIYKI